MYSNLELERSNYIEPTTKEHRVLPSAKDMLRQATLGLGGPSGEVVKVKDIRYYLGARLLFHLESGDRASKDYQLLQQAQYLSSPTGVTAAIDIFKTQFESLREELSTTPKDKRDRDLIREGLALSLSRIKLEEMLPESQEPTLKQKPTLEDLPGSRKITSEQLQSFIDVTLLKVESLKNLPKQSLEHLELLRKAKDFRRSTEGRKAAVQFIERAVGANVSLLRGQMFELCMYKWMTGDPFITQSILEDLVSRGDPVAVGRLKMFNEINEQISTFQNIVTNVVELMGELERGSKRA